VFVMPSHSETYGLVLIEAMAMQKPVVATDAGGAPELARHNQEALLVPPNNPERLGAAIATILGDHALSSRLAANARTRAITHFDEEHCVDQFLNALESLPPV
jgi:glycogen(starch) synthase